MISVIIPTLNEMDNVTALIGALQAEPETSEIIVADAASPDGTAERAEALGARVIFSKTGRGRQLLAGAEAATGDVMLFLHADTKFPEGGLGAITEALAERPECRGGNFRLLFDGDDKFSRWLEGFYAWIRARGFYYGDSGIFVRRLAYAEIGPIRPLALMEDLDFVRRMEEAGPTCYIETPTLVTSSRRFEGRAAGEIVWGWIKIHALYYLGVESERLARLYNSERRDAPA